MTSLYTPAYSTYSNGSSNNGYRTGHRNPGFLKVNEDEVPESRHTIFIRGLPGYTQLEQIQRFFEDNGHGSATIEFHKQTEGGNKLVVAVRFASRDSARDAMNRFKEDRVLGHKVELSWFRDIRKYVSYIREREVIEGRDQRRDHREPRVLRTTDHHISRPIRKRGPHTPSPVRSNSRSSKRSRGSRRPVSRSPIRRRSSYTTTEEGDLEEGETRDGTPDSLNSVSMAGDDDEQIVEDRYTPEPRPESLAKTVASEVFVKSASVASNGDRDSGHHSTEHTITSPAYSPCPPPPPPPVPQVVEQHEIVATPVVTAPQVFKQESFNTPAVHPPSNTVMPTHQTAVVTTCTDQLLARLVSTQTRLVEQLQPLEPAPARLQQMQEFRDRRREQVLAGLSTQQAHVINAKARLLEQTHLRDSETYAFVASALLAKDPSLELSIRFALKEVLEDMKTKFVDEIDNYIGANFGQ